MTENDPVGAMVAQREALTELGRVLYSLLPEGAIELVLTIRGATVLTDEFTKVAVHEDGSKTYPRSGFEVSRAFCRLRAAMYRPGVGTWFSARFTVTTNGTMDAEYNYDDEPQWFADVVPGTYVDDLERFPRDPEHIPVWLQRKLDEAAVEDS